LLEFLRLYKKNGFLEDDHMKIGIVRGPYLNPWEAQTWYPLMETHDVVFFGAINGFFDVSDIPNTRLTPFHKISMTYFSTRLLKELNGFDVIHAVETYHAFTLQCALLKNIYKFKLFSTCWENIPYPHPSFEGRLNRTVVKNKADLLIAVTEKSKHALMEEGVNEKKIVVIPPGIDLDRFRPFRSKLREFFQEEIVILFIGRLTEEKGIIELLNAMEQIWFQERTVRPRLIICGDGRLKEYVLQKRERFPITYYENFQYSSITDLYNTCDIFVLPSKSTKGWQEQFGMVLIEAMACGKPVVSTTSGSIPYVVDNDCSLLVEAGNTTALRDAIMKLMDDIKLRKEMGGKAREFAEKKYDNRKISNYLENIYNFT
jgi:alpha-maltose-1-phosphate synthase